MAKNSDKIIRFGHCEESNDEAICLIVTPTHEIASPDNHRDRNDVNMKLLLPITIGRSNDDNMRLLHCVRNDVKQ